MTKLILILAILVGAFARADSGFDGNGQLILEKDFDQLIFPRDLDKTNLKIVRSTPENPFEWAGRIQSKTAEGYIFPCSGGVVALPGYRPQDKALVLTAGHCTNDFNSGQLKPHQVLLDYPLNGEMYFDFPRSRKVKNDKGEVISGTQFNFNRVLFSSFDVVDIALLEMNETYEQLQYGSEKPPMLIRRAYKPNEPITAFGVPATEKYLAVRFHLSSCTTQGLVTYHSVYGNAESADAAYDLTRRVYMNCTMMPGMSGGYIRDAKGHVIGVNSGSMRDNYSFYAGTAPLMNCATKEGRFDMPCLATLKTKIETWKGKANKQ